MIGTTPKERLLRGHQLLMEARRTRSYKALYQSQNWFSAVQLSCLATQLEKQIAGYCRCFSVIPFPCRWKLGLPGDSIKLSKRHRQVMTDNIKRTNWLKGKKEAKRRAIAKENAKYRFFRIGDAFSVDGRTVYISQTMIARRFPEIGERDKANKAESDRLRSEIKTYTGQLSGKQSDIDLAKRERLFQCFPTEVKMLKEEFSVWIREQMRLEPENCYNF